MSDGIHGESTANAWQTLLVVDTLAIKFESAVGIEN